MDRRGRGLCGKRRMGIGPIMKNKRPDDEEKVCQYFLQGKCLKVKYINIKVMIIFYYKSIFPGK